MVPHSCGSGDWPSAQSLASRHRGFPTSETLRAPSHLHDGRLGGLHVARGRELCVAPALDESRARSACRRAACSCTRSAGRSRNEYRSCPGATRGGCSSRPASCSQKGSCGSRCREVKASQQAGRAHVSVFGREEARNQNPLAVTTRGGAALRAPLTLAAADAACATTRARASKSRHHRPRAGVRSLPTPALPRA